MLKNAYKSDKGVEKMIGGFIPIEIFEYITLYSLAKSTSKTAILLEIVTRFYNERKAKFPESDLIEMVIEKILVERKIKKMKEFDFSIDNFIRELKTTLIAKGINDKVIVKILKRI